MDDSKKREFFNPIQANQESKTREVDTRWNVLIPDAYRSRSIHRTVQVHPRTLARRLQSPYEQEFCAICQGLPQLRGNEVSKRANFDL